MVNKRTVIPIVLVVLLVATILAAVPLISAQEPEPNVLNLVGFMWLPGWQEPSEPMPYVAGYDAGDKDTTTRVKTTVSFPDTSPSVIPSDNYLAGGMFLQGQESRQVEPWRHTDYGFLASLSLDHNGVIQYNMAFYRTHEPWYYPPEGGWYECVWKDAVVLDGVNPAEPVTLTMQWDNGWIKWFYTINGNTNQAGAYYALNYSYSIIQKFYHGHYHEESGGAADFFYYQFGIYSKTALDTSGWNVRLENPMYYDDSGNQWKLVSKARSTQGTQSYLDHWYRWGGEAYFDVGARYYENGMLQEEFVVEFYGADGASVPLNWLLWGRNIDWFSPTGHSDPDGGWYNPYETRAYDDNENTYALTEVTRRNTWSKFLYLTHSPKLCRKIRILNKDAIPGNNYYHDIDVYKDGSWVGVYYGSGIGTTWKEISFDVGVVSQMRIRVRRLTGPSYVVMRIFEADFGALIEEDWFSPTGYSDPNGGWRYETRAYDDNEDTYAYTGSLYRDAWSKWLYLTHSPITCNRIRVLNKYSPSVCYYDIWYYDEY
jgi:hypothetical protein